MIKIVAFLLVVTGAINWLTIGMLQYDFIAGIFGTQANIFSRLIYATIGIAGVYIALTTLFKGGKLYLSFRKAKNISDEKKKSEYRRELEQEYNLEPKSHYEHNRE